MGGKKRKKLPGGRHLRLLSALEILEARREAEQLARDGREKALCANACLLARAVRRGRRAVYPDGRAVLKRLTAEEIAACYYSVESFDGDDELHAVGTLIDDNVYDKLDEEGKERYVLNAAELYSELKNEVLRHRKSV